MIRLLPLHHQGSRRVVGGIIMEIGDLIESRDPRQDGYQNIAYIIGFDWENDVRIIYLKPDPNRSSNKDLDYRSRWRLVNDSNQTKSR